MGELVLLIVASSLIMASMNMGVVGASNDGVINVGGQVLCHVCKQTLNQATPIQGSKVAITCYGRSAAIYYGSAMTDVSGKYQLTLSSSIDGKKVNPRNCLVKLVNSPDPLCNIATNVNGGLAGVRLDVPATVEPTITKYRLHPFYYTTCV